MLFLHVFQGSRNIVSEPEFRCHFLLFLDAPGQFPFSETNQLGGGVGDHFLPQQRGKLFLADRGGMIFTVESFLLRFPDRLGFVFGVGLEGVGVSAERSGQLLAWSGDPPGEEGIVATVVVEPVLNHPLQFARRVLGSLEVLLGHLVLAFFLLPLPAPGHNLFHLLAFFIDGAGQFFEFRCELLRVVLILGSPLVFQGRDLFHGGKEGNNGP